VGFVSDVLLSFTPSRGAGARLTSALREAVDSGRLPAGTGLPSTRVLAADLAVSRGVVVGAYEQLVAEGRLVARPGSGTVVAGLPRPSLVDSSAASPVPTGPLPLRPGVPDLGMFPRSAWRRSYDHALRSVADHILDYGDPCGVAILRQELADYLGRVRAARATAEHVVVTTGAAQAMTLLATVLSARGVTRIGVEDPGSRGVVQQFTVNGLDVVPVPLDAEGIDVPALAATGVRAVFVTPAHQFPLGMVLSPRRRAALVAWARARDGLVIEDDYDAEFRYDREPVGCMQGLAPDVVALVVTASKALAPGLRRGWLVVPPALREMVAASKAAADLGGSVLEQVAFAHLLATGAYDRHLRHARRVHRERRDALVAALGEYLPGARVSGVAAGLHLVVEFDEGTDDVAIVDAVRPLGLGPLALSSLRLGTAGPPGLVLGYAAQTPDELREAVRRLSAVVISVTRS
jgi:GntR family transcriptional regulator/MocR family aminotransferase